MSPPATRSATYKAALSGAATFDYRAVRVEWNRPVAQATFQVRLRWPEAAGRFCPGQFMMLRVPQRTDPLLGRPFAVWDVWTDGRDAPAGVDVVYEVVGKVTGLMASLQAGDTLWAWGPLGNGFGPARPVRRLVMVAGGIGLTPFLALAKQYRGLGFGGQAAGPDRTGPEVELLYGVRSAPFLAAVDQFEAVGVRVRIATEDGTAGHRGLVTELLPAALEGRTPAEVHVVACGPEPMLAAAAKIAAHYGVGCQVSLEQRMACGFGACFSCVARLRTPEGAWDYRRTCTDGPVFDARDVVF